jgi:adenylate cyclase class IV
MMRVRDEVTAGSACRSVFTLKSWVHTADGGKERLESESVVSPLVRTMAIIIGRYATGRELLSFSKERTKYEGRLADREIEVALDRVSGLGKFSGYFLEVECVVPINEDPAGVRTEIFKFVETLFGKPREDVKNSYLEMLQLSKQA